MYLNNKNAITIMQQLCPAAVSYVLLLDAVAVKVNIQTTLFISLILNQPKDSTD